MSQQKLLKKTIQVLEQSGIEYMLTGSIVSSLQGEPRSTHDIDIIIALEKESARKLAQAFPPPDFYLDEEVLFEAVERQSMCNLIDIAEGNKVDFWILTDSDFDQSRFTRRYSEKFSDLNLQVSTPEDTILAKLRWAKLSGGSEKQFTDALRVYEVQYETLDMTYLQHWADRLSVQELWERMTVEAQVI